MSFGSFEPRKLAKAVAVVAVTIAGVVATTTALAASRSQSWTGVATGFPSQKWHSGAKGNHTFNRVTCSDNHPAATYWTTFTLFHHRGGPIPDENKGAMVYQRTCNGTSVAGTAYSNDTENHYWRITYNHNNISWLRLSGSGRQYYPG